MTYSKKINRLLKPKKKFVVKVLDLFSGCGGLSLGFEALGFETFGYEMNGDAVSSYNKNLLGNCTKIQLTTDFHFPKANIIIGGPPCQPFSLSGKQTGSKDSRNGFPIFIEAVRQVKPKVFVLENVTGLAYSNKCYLESIISELQNIGYLLECHIINAVNYGIPQKRERLVIVGHKSKFNWPAPSINQVSVFDAIGELMYNTDGNSKFLTESMNIYIAKYEKASACTTPRDLHPNKPARTLTCKNLSGATGDMQRILLQDGRRRRLTIREAARLQSFPDWFQFQGSEASQFNQIGNAVPPLLSYQIANEVYQTYLRRAKSKKEIQKINDKKEQTTINSFKLKIKKVA